ncbi:MAG: RNA 2',3'-cyclic phosphodiesterase [Thioploca sp.]|nr:RNA 2',3'-cyclic phosphodiesterase [Thioploca sp.]
MINSVTERLFFALYPNEMIFSHLSQLSQVITDTQGIMGKIIPPVNWHITLAFLGDINKATKQCLQQVATTVKSDRFDLSLDQLGYWPKTQILWLGASQTPELLTQLVTQLTIALQSCGYHPEKRPFHAHITLIRKANRIKDLPSITPITWSVRDFCLVRSTLTTGGAHYEIITRWALT